ncbi:murein transglycosylase A [Fodinicurvata halophila]|uniref:peptidoglycan lytic exotransglycosylase n=1 Tax=Fodinicurvata halophila TaxID=1419723 RepID=A0ABV8UN50_9PROT
MSVFRNLVTVVLAVVLLSACQVLPPPDGEKEEPAGPEEAEVVFQPASFTDLPGWRDDRFLEALPAMRRSCSRLVQQPAERSLGPRGQAGTIADWRGPCEALRSQNFATDDELRRFLEANFRPFSVEGRPRQDGLFTGYYEAEIEASRTRGNGYDVPLHAPPDDLVTADLGAFDPELGGERLVGRVTEGAFQPYHSRAEIEEGALQGKSEVLLWGKDPVDVFFLHIQGSGVATLPDGRRQRIGFAASNGRSFYAIGRALIEEGAVSRNEASMQSIRQWLQDNPDRADALMRRNKRYIFFREIDEDGPIGAQGVPLTAGRSLAVDRDFLPLGVPLWLETNWPNSQAQLSRLMVAQDTGSAITGPVRGDFFWGSGEEAFERAGRMKEAGRYWILLPDAVAERVVAQGSVKPES